MTQIEQAEAEKDWDTAIALGEEILRANASHSKALRKTGLAYGKRATGFMEDRDYVRAIVDFNYAIEKTPGKAEYYLKRWECWQTLRKYEKSIADFEQFLKLEPEQNNQVVQFLIEILDESDNNKLRAKAAYALGKTSDMRAVEALSISLHDYDSSVRSQATISLAIIGDKRVVKPLIIALQDLNGYVRARSAMALGDIDDSQAVEPLITILKDQDSYVRFNAARALGEIGDARALPELERLAREDNGATSWGEKINDMAQQAIKQIKTRHGEKPE